MTVSTQHSLCFKIEAVCMFKSRYETSGFSIIHRVKNANKCQLYKQDQLVNHPATKTP